MAAELENIIRQGLANLPRELRDRILSAIVTADTEYGRKIFERQMEIFLQQAQHAEKLALTNTRLKYPWYIKSGQAYTIEARNYYCDVARLALCLKNTGEAKQAIEKIAKLRNN